MFRNRPVFFKGQRWIEFEYRGVIPQLASVDRLPPKSPKRANQIAAVTDLYGVSTKPSIMH